MWRPQRLALLSGLAFLISFPLFVVIWLPIPAPAWVGWTIYFVAMALFVVVGPGLLVTALVLAWTRRRRA